MSHVDAELSADNPKGEAERARRALPYHGIGDDLVGFWWMLWEERRLFFLIEAIFIAGALAYAFTATQWFRSESLLIPATPKSAQGLASQLGGALSGIAGLAGLSLLGSGNTAEPIAVLRSRDLLREFIQQNNLLPVIFASRWDAATGQWKDSRPAKQPDVRDGVKYFRDNVLTVLDDKKTGMVTLSVEWTDAGQATAWANQLIDRVNERMRDRAIAESETNIAYLRAQIASINETALQQAVSRLLETELQKAMLARGNKDFAFRVVDPPETPRRRSRPNRSLAVALGFLAGGIFGVAIIMVRRAFRNSRVRLRREGS